VDSSTDVGLAAALSYVPPVWRWATRFLLTADSTVPDEIKQALPCRQPWTETVVSTRVDGMPHRVLRTGLVEKARKWLRVRGFAAAVRNAAKFKKMSQMNVGVHDP